MPLIGQAVRHEYILAYTKNFIVLIEVNSDHHINFLVFNAKTENKKKEVFEKIQKEMAYERNMRTIEGKDIY